MLGQGVLAGDLDSPESLFYLQACQATSVECQPVVQRNTASFPQSLLECGNCSGLREKKEIQYFRRRASSHPFKTCFLLKMKLNPRVEGPQQSAAAAATRCWGLPIHRPGGGHSAPGPAAVEPPASSAVLWGAGSDTMGSHI